MASRFAASASADRPRRHQDVLLDRELGDQAAVLGHVADAELGAAVHRQRGQRRAVKGDRAGLRRQQAHDRCASAWSCRRRCGRSGPRTRRPATLSVTLRRIATEPIDTSRFAMRSMGLSRATAAAWIGANHVAPHLGVVQHGVRRTVGDDAPLVERQHTRRRSGSTISMSCSTKRIGDALGAHRCHHAVHERELLVVR